MKQVTIVSTFPIQSEMFPGFLCVDEMIPSGSQVKCYSMVFLFYNNSDTTR